MKKLAFALIAIAAFTCFPSIGQTAAGEDGCQVWAVEGSGGVAVCPDTSSFRFTFYDNDAFEVGDLISNPDGTFGNWVLGANSIVLKKDQGSGSYISVTILIERVEPPMYEVVQGSNSED